MPPIDVAHTALSFEQAEIQWLVPSIVYTPENYTVVYGTDENMLNYTSSVIVGSNDVTATNQIHNVTLSELQPSTTYYYTVTARNIVGENRSNVRSVTTPPQSKFDVNLYQINVKKKITFARHHCICELNW